MKIKNFETLAQTPLRQVALRVVEAGLEAIDTVKVIKQSVQIAGRRISINGRDFSLAADGRLFVVGVGKCSLNAALALEDILGDQITDGLVADVACPIAPKRIRFCKGDHPYPTEANIDLTAEIITLLKGIGEKDTVIFIISGGGTVMLCQPENHTCAEEREVVKALFKAGATIAQMNTIRKHLSLARGGFLAKHAFPAQVISLILSDVPGNDLSMVASGPTVLDETTVTDAKKIVEEYGLAADPNFDFKHFIETPKEKKYFKRVSNLLIISNDAALLAMAAKAKELGFSARICTSCLSGEAREVGRDIAAELGAAPPKSAALFGGETTVTVKGDGKGGRNQELVLGALEGISEGAIALAIASDGIDNTEVAGALCDTIIKSEAEKLGANPKSFLARNDSFSFFEKVGGQIVIGPTGSNVSDLVLAIKN